MRDANVVNVTDYEDFLRQIVNVLAAIRSKQFWTSNFRCEKNTQSAADVPIVYKLIQLDLDIRGSTARDAHAAA